MCCCCNYCYRCCCYRYRWCICISVHGDGEVGVVSEQIRGYHGHCIGPSCPSVTNEQKRKSPSRDLNPGPPHSSKYMPSTLTTELPGLGSDQFRVHLYPDVSTSHDRLHIVVRQHLGLLDRRYLTSCVAALPPLTSFTVITVSPSPAQLRCVKHELVGDVASS